MGLSLLLSTGCITRAGGNLEPIDPPVPANPPSIEYTVGDFEATLEGGKMVTSNKAGRNLADLIFESWQDAGYISDFAYVPDGAFSPEASERITLSGSQYGDSSVVMQVLSGLTLALLPYTVDTKWDIQFTYVNQDSGASCTAEAADSFFAVVELLLVFAAPVAARGAQQTVDGMGDHLFQQLSSECGFGDQAHAGGRDIGTKAGRRPADERGPGTWPEAIQGEGDPR